MPTVATETGNPGGQITKNIFGYDNDLRDVARQTYDEVKMCWDHFS